MRWVRNRNVEWYIERAMLWVIGYGAISWALWPALGHRVWVFTFGLGWIGASWIKEARRW